MKFSLFKEGIKNTKPSMDIGIAKAFQFIRRGDFMQEIENLRRAVDKSIAKVIKSNLTYMTFSGTFKKREDQSLIKHSGLMCIDFDLNGEYKAKELSRQLGISPKEALEIYGDNFPVSEFNINAVKYLLSLDPHTLMLFISPSGDGLKLITRIEPERHVDSFLWLEQYYLDKYGLYIDQSGKDISRACFVSYDPEVFLNPDAVVVPVNTALEVKKKADLDPNKYRIDQETGEVIEINQVTDDLKKDYDRAVQVVQRICEAKKDITSQYDDWRNIGFSFAVFGEAGRDLYHKVSQFNDDYDRQMCDTKFNDFLKNGRFKNANAFFKLAKEFGIDTRFVRVLQNAVAKGATGAGEQNYSYDLPEGCECTNEIKAHTWKYHFIEYNNRYYFADVKMNDREVKFHPISNFIIAPLFLIVSKAEPKRIVEIRNVTGVTKVLDIPTKAFVSQTEFYTFIESQGNFLMEANKVQFHKIKSKLYDQAVNSEEIKTLGWHKDGFYAFANGIYSDRFEPTDDHGVVEFTRTVNGEDGTPRQVKKYYFIPALSSIYRDEDEDFEAQKKFVFKRHDIKLKAWADAFLLAYKDNGKIGLLYYITCLFRDIIYDRFKYFPHLFLFGPPGSGKSTMAWSFMSLFGEQQLPFNLNGGTKVAFHKKFATFRNGIIWFDEYSNSIEQVRVQALKAAYDGTGHEKSEMSAANRTKTTPVLSGCLISGQELPIADNALFKRTILLQYSRSEFSQEEKNNHAALLDIEKEGVSFLTASICTLRNLYEEKFLSEFSVQIKSIKDELQKESVEERLIQHAALMLTTFSILQPKLNLPLDYDNLKTIFLDQIRMQNNLIANSKETGTFWDLVEFMLEEGPARGIKDGRDFKIEYRTKIKVYPLNAKEPVEIPFFEEDGKTLKLQPILLIRLTKIHPLYLTFHRNQYSKNGLDKGSLINYLCNQKYYIGTVSGTRFEDCVSSCFAFDYGQLMEEGVNLERSKDDSSEQADTGEKLPTGKDITPDKKKKEEPKDLPF